MEKSCYCKTNDKMGRLFPNNTQTKLMSLIHKELLEIEKEKNEYFLEKSSKDSAENVFLNIKSRSTHGIKKKCKLKFYNIIFTYKDG